MINSKSSSKFPLPQAPSSENKFAAEQVRNLRKALHYKELEYNKDKAVWVQNYELVSKELQETREQLEAQKKNFLQIIGSLKLTNSPNKHRDYNIEIRFSDLNNKKIDLDESILSSASHLAPPRLAKVPSAISLNDIVKNDPDIQR